MTDNGDTYELLFKSINRAYAISETTKANATMLRSFVKYANTSHDEVAKFANASQEIVTKLNDFDFSQGLNYQPIKVHLTALQNLRKRLVKMTDIARNLSTYPDRHGSKESIDKCKELVIACSTKMKLSEIEKVSELVDRSIQKLDDVQELFKQEAAKLEKIKMLIQDAAKTLKPLIAYRAELMQYVAEFPHCGEDDYDMVVCRIAVANKILELINKVKRDSNSIKDYYDRNGKGAVMNKCTELMHRVKSEMQFTDTALVESQLNEAVAQIKKVAEAFENEEKDLAKIQTEVKQNSCGLWLEDSKRIQDQIKNLSKKNIKFVAFDIQAMKANLKEGRARRAAKIAKAQNLYPWLVTNEDYKQEHNSLIKRKILEKTYVDAVNEWIKQRHRWMIFVGIVPYVIWRLFIYVKFE